MITHDEMDYAEYVAMGNAMRFLSQWDDWNEDNVLEMACDWHGFDYDYVWLTSRVLFEPAVWKLSTGKTM